MPMRFEALQAVAIAASQERSLKVVLEGVVRGVSQSGGLALARVWLLGPDSVCEVCRRLPGIPDQSERLHLMASAGRPVSSVYRNEDWSRLDGDFHRGGIKIAEVNGTAKPVLVSIENDHRWIERPDWARRERIRSFAGHPLIFRGQGVGAIGVFSRRLISEAEFDWLRLFAVAAAVTISNARAFDEIDRLRQHLEGENAYLRDEITTATDGEIILGNSASMRRVECFSDRGAAVARAQGGYSIIRDAFHRIRLPAVQSVWAGSKCTPTEEVEGI
jgi:GAF domain-containing protein